MVVYIFGFPGGWTKMGYTARCPYVRQEFGFWQNLHPSALCGRLADAELLHLFEGGEDIERALHSALAADVGEFYAPGRLSQILGLHPPHR